MRMSQRSLSRTLTGLALASVLVLAGCGGGGGGGGGGGASQLFTFTGTINYGMLDAGGALMSSLPYPLLPVNPLGGDPIPLVPGTNPAVGAAVFPTGSTMGVVRQDFIEIEFTGPVLGSSIQSQTGGVDGIVLFREDPVTNLLMVEQFLVDSMGVVDAGNAWSGDGAAPGAADMNGSWRLRIYAPGTDNDLSTPDVFPDGEYTLQITEQLRGFNGAGSAGMPFSTDGRSTSNSILPELSFTVGTPSGNLTVKQSTVCAASGGTTPLNLDNNVALNQEITLEFNRAIAFETLVGAPNLTTLDPFITIPIPLNGANANCPGMMGPPNAIGVDIGDLYVGLLLPLDPATMAPDPPPANLAVIAYMPDPIARPNLVRIRFVDNTNLVGTETLPNGPFQNYASNANRAELAIPTNDPAAIAAAANAGQSRPTLALPPVLSVPGSLPTYVPGSAGSFQTDPIAMQLQVVVADPTLTDPTGNGCSLPFGTTTSRSGQPFTFCAAQPAFLLNTAYQAGVALARNASVPDLVIYSAPNTPGLGAINAAAMTNDICGIFDSSGPVSVGGAVTGNFNASPNPLANSQVLGTPLDVEIGRFIGVNNILVAPRGNATTRGIPDTQNGVAPDSLLTPAGGCMGPNPIPQPYGNFLYVVDGDSRELKVFNSYNFSPITTIPGVRSPGGLGIDPSASRLYVSNFNDGTIQVINTIPTSPQFHTVTGTVAVEAGPRAVSVMGSNEAVMVANFGSNSVTRLDAAGLAVRATFRDPSMLGPEDVFATARMLGQGQTNAFSVFIPCSISNSVAIFESDSFVVGENGFEGIIKGIEPGFQSPRGGIWNWRNFVSSPGSGFGAGAYIANSTGTSVDEVGMFNFTLGQPIGFPGPPGTRDYRVLRSIQTGQFTGQIPATASPRDVTAENMSAIPGAVIMAGGSPNKVFRDGGGADNPPPVLLISYPSEGRVMAWDGVGNTYLNDVAVPGVDMLFTYYDQ